MIKKVVVQSHVSYLDEVLFGLTLIERIAYASLYAGIEELYVPLKYVASLQNLFKKKKLAIFSEEGELFEKETLMIDQSVIVNDLFLKGLKENYLEEKNLLISEKTDWVEETSLFKVCYLVQSKKDIYKNKNLLLQSLRKKQDTLLAYLFNREISIRMTGFLSSFSFITPTRVTFLALLLGIFSIGLLSTTTSSVVAAFAGFTMYFSSLLDGVDGELARLTYSFSRLGLWLDNVTDEVLNFLIIIGTQLYSYHLTGQSVFVYLMSVSVLCFIAGKSLQYLAILFKLESEDISQFSIPKLSQEQWYGRFATKAIEVLQHIPRADMMKFSLMMFAFFKILSLYAYLIGIFAIVFFIGVVFSTLQTIFKIKKGAKRCD